MSWGGTSSSSKSTLTATAFRPTWSWKKTLAFSGYSSSSSPPASLVAPNHPIRMIWCQLRKELVLGVPLSWATSTVTTRIGLDTGVPSIVSLVMHWQASSSTFSQWLRRTYSSRLRTTSKKLTYTCKLSCAPSTTFWRIPCSSPSTKKS